MDNGNVSPGEVGGVFAGLSMGLALLGKGIAWLVNWKQVKEDSRATRLRVWEESLDRREREHREHTEARLVELEDKLTAVTMAAFLTMGELQRLDPASSILASARLALQRAYPVDLEIPDELQALIRKVGLQEEES